MSAANTIQFFRVTDSETKASILEAIANHYGITPSEAEEEVTDFQAESLTDYLVGPIRDATQLLMKRHGFA
jgi:hypothetical protein